MHVSLVFWATHFVLIFASSAYKILVYNPQFLHSHVTFLGHIADTLTRAGHDVVVYLPAFSDKVNSTGVKLSRVLYRPRDFDLPFTMADYVSDAWTKSGQDLSQVIKMTWATGVAQKTLCDRQLADVKLLEKLRGERFDLGITEVMSFCGFALFQKVNVPAYISAFSTNMIEMMTVPFGIDNNPSFVPAAFSELSDEMSYLERAQNLATYALTWLCGQLLVTPLLKYENATPSFQYRKAVGNSAFVFVNSDEFIEFPRPINHKIVYIGGIGVQKPKDLSEDFASIMENAPGPVALVSFGSMARSSEMPSHIKASFVQMFANLPQVTFIWKYEVDDDIAANLTNVIKRKWVPQNDLFGHQKLRAFVTHGGLNSVTESTNAGIPMVCIPLFGDQMRNAKMIEKRGVAKILSKQLIDSKTLTEAVKAVLYDEKYQAASKRLSQMIRKKPISVEERVVKFAEFAALFKDTNNLQPSSVKLNFIQYYLLDVIIPFIVISTAFLILLVYASMYLYRKLCKICRTGKMKTE